MWLFIVGLVLALAGVGGVENSLNDWQLAGSALVSAGGLLLMWAGTILVKLTQENEMQEAVAHMKQLMLAGAGYVQAVTDTVTAFSVDQFDLQRAYHASPQDYRLP